MYVCTMQYLLDGTHERQILCGVCAIDTLTILAMAAAMRPFAAVTAETRPV